MICAAKCKDGYLCSRELNKGKYCWQHKSKKTQKGGGIDQEYISPILKRTPNLINFIDKQCLYFKPNLYKINPSFMYHYFDPYNLEISFRFISEAYKGYYFSTINSRLLSKTVNLTSENVRDTKLDNQIYIFLQGILDLPRFDQELIVYRSLRRYDNLGNNLESIYQVGKIIPTNTFLSTGLNVGNSVENQITLKIIIPKNFPIYLYYQCTDELYSEMNLETSEVILPFTTDPTGQTLTWGFKVLKKEPNKILNIDQGTLITTKTFITVEIVMLSNPLKVFNFSPELAKFDHVVIGLFPALKNYGISDDAIRKLKAEDVDEFDILKSLTKQEFYQLLLASSDIDKILKYCKRES